MKNLFLVFLIGFSISISAADFQVTSPTISEGGTLNNKHVFDQFGCKGENLSPSLKWTNAPLGTKSFAVTVFDLDAPTGSGWWHWTLVNIPANITELKEGANKKNLPKGVVEGRTDFGKPGFGGPCPPAGDKPHRYVFTVYALKTAKLDINSDSSGALVGYNIGFTSLAKASITINYGRVIEK
ncbi:Raf-like protein [Leptospira ryugenii]|uniref:Raf-like protein n=1 Tax=Leptospira ryugenii TaxID=1917863 RepID=A0A2P2E2Y3_9LEPT|nr:YbhB/YbcL family Raf kinase inhibitor-like protein [Leptospira ryugenii]GBF51219.1 Raf-like protein [Leptospira ryugenii]